MSCAKKSATSDNVNTNNNTADCPEEESVDSALVCDDSLIKRLLYPDVEPSSYNGENKWGITITSKAASVYGTFFTWNETNHPDVSTQFEDYNYGGIGLISNDSLIDTRDVCCLTIDKVVAGGENPVIACISGEAFHGDFMEYLKVYVYSSPGNWQYKGRFLIHYDNNATTGTTLFNADYEFTPLDCNTIELSITAKEILDEEGLKAMKISLRDTVLEIDRDLIDNETSSENSD